MSVRWMLEQRCVPDMAWLNKLEPCLLILKKNETIITKKKQVNKKEYTPLFLFELPQQENIMQCNGEEG